MKIVHCIQCAATGESSVMHLPYEMTLAKAF